jgi:hypothetical protein
MEVTFSHHCVVITRAVADKLLWEAFEVPPFSETHGSNSRRGSGTKNSHKQRTEGATQFLKHVNCSLNVTEELEAKEGCLRIDKERTKDEERNEEQERIHGCECEAGSTQKLQDRTERIFDEKGKGMSSQRMVHEDVG